MRAVEVFEHGYEKRERLAGACLGRTEYVAALEGERDRTSLDGGKVVKVAGCQSGASGCRERQVGELLDRCLDVLRGSAFGVDCGVQDMTYECLDGLVELVGIDIVALALLAALLLLGLGGPRTASDGLCHGMCNAESAIVEVSLPRNNV